MANRLLGARMGAIVNHSKLRCCQLRVTLGGAEALMTQQLLDGAQVCALLKQMSSKSMAQGVRMHV